MLVVLDLVFGFGLVIMNDAVFTGQAPADGRARHTKSPHWKPLGADGSRRNSKSNTKKDGASLSSKKKLLYLSPTCEHIWDKPPPLIKLGVYDVNLERSKERLAGFTEQMNGVPFRIIKAFDGVSRWNSSLLRDFPCLPRDGLGGRTAADAVKSGPASKAIFFSNAKAMRAALRDGVDWALVFQDDAVLPPNFWADLGCHLDRAGPETSVLYLDARNPPGRFAPGCCLSGMLFRRDALTLLRRDLFWPTSPYMRRYRSMPRTVVASELCLHDWFLANLLAFRNVSVVSAPCVGSGAFASTISVAAATQARKWCGWLGCWWAELQASIQQWPDLEAESHTESTAAPKEAPTKSNLDQSVFVEAYFIKPEAPGSDFVEDDDLVVGNE
jgi:hypothetical protein